MKTLTIFLLSILLLPGISTAGGIFIDNESVRIIAADPCAKEYLPNENLQLNYFYSAYVSSFYEAAPKIVFRIRPMFTITGSVGKGGVNRERDVTIIRSSLIDKGYLREGESGIDRVIQAIFEVQRFLNFSNPDGRVDVQGKTINFLSPKSYFTEIITGDVEGVDIEAATRFNAPGVTGKYIISYNGVAYFSDSGVPGINDLDNYYRDNYVDLAEFEVIDERPAGHCVKGRLRLNGEMPNLNATSSDIIARDNKFSISWLIEAPEAVDSLFFQYRLKPLYDEWSEWTLSRNVEFAFAPKGINIFELRCRYQWMDTVNITTLARLSLDLPKNYIADKVTYKGFERNDRGEIVFIDDNTEKTAGSNTEVIERLYKSSKALVLSTGVQYDHFDPLQYINNDIDRVAETLEKQFFQVTKTTVSSNKEMEEALNDFLFNQDHDYKERLLVYITSHGFMDNNKFYIATKECDSQNPISTCLDFEAIKAKTNALEKPKHKLIIVDACASGVGILTKSFDDRLAKTLTSNEGFSMISAGMNNQKAEMHPEKEMSLFSYYFCKGINGEADTFGSEPGDGFITLSELIVYLQKNVNRDSKKGQLPLLGRLNGSGEMIFISN